MENRIMTQPWMNLLTDVSVTEPQEVNGLRVFGLRWGNPDGLPYTTLDEALAAGTVELTEVNDGGAVPTLRLVNRGDSMVFLLAGEHLIGAKQNRVLNTDIMAGAHSDLPIPVSCVEAGRWRYRAARFAGSGTLSHSVLRKMMYQQAHAGYRNEGKPTSDQGAVWGEVARKLTKMGSASETRALEKVYEDYESRLQGILEQVHLPEGGHGVAFAWGGKIAGADLFDRPDTLARFWPKLLRAYALDALEEADRPAVPVDAEAVRRWLWRGRARYR
jgi:hypothetical protein